MCLVYVPSVSVCRQMFVSREQTKFMRRGDQLVRQQSFDTRRCLVWETWTPVGQLASVKLSCLLGLKEKTSCDLGRRSAASFPDEIMQHFFKFLSAQLYFPLVLLIYRDTEVMSLWRQQQQKTLNVYVTQKNPELLLPVQSCLICSGTSQKKQKKTRKCGSVWLLHWPQIGCWRKGLMVVNSLIKWPVNYFVYCCFRDHLSLGVHLFGLHANLGRIWFTSHMIQIVVLNTCMTCSCLWYISRNVGLWVD